jgi:hypothetical protein
MNLVGSTQEVVKTPLALRPAWLPAAGRVVTSNCYPLHRWEAEITEIVWVGLVSRRRGRCN